MSVMASDTAKVFNTLRKELDYIQAILRIILLNKGIDKVDNIITPQL